MLKINDLCIDILLAASIALVACLSCTKENNTSSESDSEPEVFEDVEEKLLDGVEYVGRSTYSGTTYTETELIQFKYDNSDRLRMVDDQTGSVSDHH